MQKNSLKLLIYLNMTEYLLSAMWHRININESKSIDNRHIICSNDAIRHIGIFVSVETYCEISSRG